MKASAITKALQLEPASNLGSCQYPEGLPQCCRGRNPKVPKTPNLMDFTPWNSAWTRGLPLRPLHHNKYGGNGIRTLKNVELLEFRVHVACRSLQVLKWCPSILLIGLRDWASWYWADHLTLVAYFDDFVLLLMRQSSCCYNIIAACHFRDLCP